MRFIPTVVSRSAMLALCMVATLSCAKMQDAGQAPTPSSAAKVAEEQAPQENGLYEVQVEAKTEAEPIEVAAPPPGGPHGGSGGGAIERVRGGKSKGIGSRARPAPKPMARRHKRPSSRTQHAAAPSTGTIVDAEDTNRNGRRIVAKKTTAGALLGRGQATKRFGEGGEGDAGLVAKTFGGDDEDDAKADGRGPGALKLEGKAEDLAKQDKSETRSGKDRYAFALADSRRDSPASPAAPTDDTVSSGERPAGFLPRMCYFENTYLGGNAAYRERLRRLARSLEGADQAWMKARAAVAEIDPPGRAAMGLSASLDRRSIDGPGRVWLQIGLRGSHRYGWRRPPLDVAVVLTRDALQTDAAALKRTHATIRELVRRLGPQDRIELRVVGDEGGDVVQEPVSATELRHGIPSVLDRLDAAGAGAVWSDGNLRRSLDAAAASLVALSDNPHRVPGTRLVLLVAGAGNPRSAQVATAAAHGLQLRGAVTSVFTVAAANDVDAGWWRVANAGHGNFHRVAERGAAQAVQTELDTLSRVVARLLRINVRLGRHSNAVRILGSKILKQQEVARVKAREKRIDDALSTSMGVTADRGDDDDGIQTVIPYFYGDDSHVLLIELWVEKPGVVADITLRYKDLVNLDNATERVSVALSAVPRRSTQAQREVYNNVRATQLALSLGDAWRATHNGDNEAALPALQRAEQAAKSAADQRMVRGLKKLVLDNRSAPMLRQRAVRDALRMARDRKIGDAGADER